MSNVISHKNSSSTNDEIVLRLPPPVSANKNSSSADANFTVSSPPSPLPNPPLNSTASVSSSSKSNESLPPPPPPNEHTPPPGPQQMDPSSPSPPPPSNSNPNTSSPVPQPHEKEPLSSLVPPLPPPFSKVSPPPPYKDGNQTQSPSNSSSSHLPSPPPTPILLPSPPSPSPSPNPSSSPSPSPSSSPSPSPSPLPSPPPPPPAISNAVPESPPPRSPPPHALPPHSPIVTPQKPEPANSSAKTPSPKSALAAHPPTEHTTVKPSTSSRADSESSRSGTKTVDHHHAERTDSTSLTPESPSPSSDADHSVRNGVIAGLSAFVIFALIVGLVFYVKKKKNRTHVRGSPYRPPSSVSVRLDGVYYDHEIASKHSSPDSYYAHTAPGYPQDSHRGHGFAAGLPDPACSKPWFTYDELVDITDGFCQENLIGEGGFGRVYKGWLLDGRRVAVKQLKAGGGQGEREFRAEVDIISRIHHRHLVSLVGYCIAEHHRSLVYEFVANNTLEHHLCGKDLPVMDWSKRVRIAVGSARGLAYLHEDCHPRIIHRDIKSANILLDESFEAKVADFGLAKLANDNNTHVSTRVMGTFGYMAPEYASSGKLTDRSDVFSFGVVLLELITGRKPVDPSESLGDESLVEWARPHLVNALETGNFDELVDPRLDGNFSKMEMIRMIEVAAACVRHSAPKRPRMVQVVRALDTDVDIGDITNGVKLGQSMVYSSSQYSADIQKFRMMAFESGMYGSEDGSSREYETQSSEYSRESRDSPNRALNPHEPQPVSMAQGGSLQNRDGSCSYQGRGFN